ALGESLPDDDGRLSGWLARAEDVLGREDKTARSRDKLRTQADEARAELAREQLGLDAAEGELAEWRTRWAEMMKRLDLEPGAAPEQAEIVLEKTQELFKELGKHREFQSRIRGIDRDAARTALPRGRRRRARRPARGGAPLGRARPARGCAPRLRGPAPRPGGRGRRRVLRRRGRAGRRRRARPGHRAARSHARRAA